MTLIKISEETSVYINPEQITAVRIFQNPESLYYTLSVDMIGGQTYTLDGANEEWRHYGGAVHFLKDFVDRINKTLEENN